ncbi:MAG: aquaporin, partial [Mucilaginibacter sp.]
MRKFLAEFLGTYALVFAGTGAIIIDNQTHGSVTHTGIAITFGLIVMS